MIINTNPGAAMAARILGESSSALQKSLSRLSSGSKISSPSDDAAGTGVAMKFGAQVNRIQAAKDNVETVEEQIGEDRGRDEIDKKREALTTAKQKPEDQSVDDEALGAEVSEARRV